MSTALYNRYRPATFAQIVGQEHVTSALAQALRSGRLHHAYLFSGPRGCGKTSSARILAASLNCVNGPTPEPCGTCDQCVAIRSGSAMDVIEIDAASHGLVDDARDLRERAFFAPASARFKVYVVDEAHMVTTAAFNALLKVVEEPPPFLKFVFATTEPDKVIATIRSRTHHYAFRLVPPAVLREHLARICQAENVHVAPEVLPLVARAGAGSVRDSMSVLDQLLAGAGPEGLGYERAVALLGMTDGVLLDETVDALANHDGATLFTVVDKVVSSGHDPRRFATDLLERLRDLILFEAVPDAVERGILENYSPDQTDRMRGQATALGAAELSRAADVVHAGLVEMRGTTSPRLLLELVLARALLPGAASDSSALLVRLERLERRADATGSSAPSDQERGAAPATAPPVRGPAGAAQVPVPPPVDAPRTAEERPAPTRAPVALEPDRPPSNAGPASGTGPGTAAGRPTSSPPTPVAAGGRAIDADALRARWDDVLTEVGRRSKRALAMLREHASVAEVHGDEVVLAFAAPKIAGMFSDGQTGILADALTSVFGGTWRVTVGAGGSRGGTSPAAAPTRAAGGPVTGPPRQPDAAEPSGPERSPGRPPTAVPAGDQPTAAGQPPRSPSSTSGLPAAGPPEPRSTDRWPSDDSPTPARTQPAAAPAGAAVPSATSPAADAWPTPAPLGGSRPADPGAAKHSSLDHSSVSMDHSSMDHSSMDHSRPESAGRWAPSTRSANSAAPSTPATDSPAPSLAATPAERTIGAASATDAAPVTSMPLGSGTRRTSGPRGATLRAVPSPAPNHPGGAGRPGGTPAGAVTGPPNDEPPDDDETSMDDENLPSGPEMARSREEAALALLRSDLGATIIDPPR
jgi:DNA polymerase III subunit gamma/tau